MEESDLVLCTVRSIVGTSVFVSIEGKGEASIATNEIAPGRIRNLRDYVVPGKKIVCKILKIDEKGNIHLSLRRVSEKEKKEVLEKYEKEKTCLSIIRTVAKEKALEIAEKIRESCSLTEFFQACKEKPKELEKFFTKEEAEKLCKILQEKKETKVTVKKEFFLSSSLPSGIRILKEILKPYNAIYLAAGHFSLTIKAENYKKANQEIQKILEELELAAKNNKAEFRIK